jgi:hypothetical protein
MSIFEERIRLSIERFIAGLTLSSLLHLVLYRSFTQMIGDLCYLILHTCIFFLSSPLVMYSVLVYFYMIIAYVNYIPASTFLIFAQRYDPRLFRQIFEADTYLRSAMIGTCAYIYDNDLFVPWFLISSIALFHISYYYLSFLYAYSKTLFYGGSTCCYLLGMPVGLSLMYRAVEDLYRG